MALLSYEDNRASFFQEKELGVIGRETREEGHD